MTNKFNKNDKVLIRDTIRTPWYNVPYFMTLNEIIGFPTKVEEAVYGIY